MKYFVAATFICLSRLSHAGHHEKSETSENIMAMKAAYAAFSKGDIEAWKAEHSDDVV